MKPTIKNSLSLARLSELAMDAVRLQAEKCVKCSVNSPYDVFREHTRILSQLFHHYGLSVKNGDTVYRFFGLSAATRSALFSNVDDARDVIYLRDFGDNGELGALILSVLNVYGKYID